MNAERILVILTIAASLVIVLVAMNAELFLPQIWPY